MYTAEWRSRVQAFQGVANLLMELQSHFFTSSYGNQQPVDDSTFAI